MLGTTIKHYRIDVLLGEGGMGVVYRGYDTKLGRSVAIKVLRQPSVETDTAVDRFLREGRAASALNHPNIVTIHDIGVTDDGQSFIVQEFVEGQTLRTFLGEPMDVRTAADLGSQIARALTAAHAAGIVHRDIKPENVMIRPDGIVKMLDFGLARVAPDAGHLTADVGTRPGMILGTTSYMAPEQARGEAVEPSADIFALGIVLYEMLDRQPAVRWRFRSGGPAPDHHGAPGTARQTAAGAAARPRRARAPDAGEIARPEADRPGDEHRAVIHRARRGVHPGAARGGAGLETAHRRTRQGARRAARDFSGGRSGPQPDGRHLGRARPWKDERRRGLSRVGQHLGSASGRRPGQVLGTTCGDGSLPASA